jgi:hypothetical protein
VAELPAADAPEVELVGGRDVEPVDGVAPVHHPRAHQQHVVGGCGRERTQGRRDHRGGVAAQHAVLVDVARVAHVPGDRRRRDAEPVVVVLDGDHPRPLLPAHLAAPGGGEAGDGGVDQQLDGMVALVGVGEVSHAQIVGELARAQGGEVGCHGVSSVRRGGGEPPPSPKGSPEGRRLGHAGCPREPSTGRGAPESMQGSGRHADDATGYQQGRQANSQHPRRSSRRRSWSRCR